MTTATITPFIVFAIANVFFLLALSFIVWMAVDAAKGDKYWWVVFILGVPLVGGIVYYFVEKEHDYLKMEEKVVE